MGGERTVGTGGTHGGPDWAVGTRRTIPVSPGVCMFVLGAGSSVDWASENKNTNTWCENICCHLLEKKIGFQHHSNRELTLKWRVLPSDALAGADHDRRGLAAGRGVQRPTGVREGTAAAPRTEGVPRTQASDNTGPLCRSVCRRVVRTLKQNTWTKGLSVTGRGESVRNRFIKRPLHEPQPLRGDSGIGHGSTALTA